VVVLHLPVVLEALEAEEMPMQTARQILAEVAVVVGQAPPNQAAQAL